MKSCHYKVKLKAEWYWSGRTFTEELKFLTNQNFCAVFYALFGCSFLYNAVRSLLWVIKIMYLEFSYISFETGLSFESTRLQLFIEKSLNWYE